VVAVMPGSEAEFAGLCAAHGVPAAPLGTAGGDRLEVEGGFAVPLDELAATHQGTLPALFG
jgi:phosphoribosylformylglycinamidine synthase